MKGTGYKFKITNGKHSGKVQTKLFDLGYTWASSHDDTIRYTELPILYANGKSKKITYGRSQENYDKSEYVEMRILYELQEKMVKEILLITIKSFSDDSIIPIWNLFSFGKETLEKILKEKMYNITIDAGYLNAIRSKIKRNNGSYTK